jgi:SAM-dependent methyltransferase
VTAGQNAWDERAERYRASVTHATGDDLDAVVELCNPHEGVKILDVATGGGHVARRLRELGAEVVTCDASPGMQPDVVTAAEHLPFADGSFDVVVTRIAAHHFDDLGQAVGEMVRVTNRVLVVEDMLYRTDEEQEAEKLRDPTHVRSLSADDWRDLLVDAGLEIEQELYFSKTHDMEEWLARTGCEGEDAERVRELLAPFASDDGSSWSNDYIVVKARKSQR